MKRYITLSAINKRVPLSAYIKGIKTAKAHLSAEFEHGLTCWWSCTGKEIMKQFLDGVHDRINQGIPAIKRS